MISLPEKPSAHTNEVGSRNRLSRLLQLCYKKPDGNCTGFRGIALTERFVWP
jgi:hypothetical protein